MVGAAGFEPTTSRSRTVRATSCATPRIITVKWSGKRESNPRSLAPQASTLPLSHSPEKLSIIYCRTYILAFFEKLGKGFFNFREKFYIRARILAVTSACSGRMGQLFFGPFQSQLMFINQIFNF